MQINGMNLCDFCFEAVTPGSVCSKCGLTHETYQPDAGLLSPGTNLLGKYIIGRVLGRGGFGATYLAYSNDLKRAVAIKEYLPLSIVYRGKEENTVTVISEEKKKVFDKGSKRFFEEAKTISRFNSNKNIVSVYEFFYENNTVYYSMEYLDGIDLKKYIAKNGGRLKENDAAQIIKGICNALMVVHSAQILHRDIAPDNIFMCSNGDVKLIDFGTAKQVIANVEQSYSVVVKQGFAPSEQYTQKGRQGVWTDIYALGATFYYMLCGAIPPNAIDRVENPELNFDHTLNISPEVVAIVNKCMATKIEDRYQSIIELLGDLDKISAIEEIPKTAVLPEMMNDTEKISTENKNRSIKKVVKKEKKVTEQQKKKNRKKRIVIPKKQKKVKQEVKQFDIKKKLLGNINIVVFTCIGLVIIIALCIAIATVLNQSPNNGWVNTGGTAIGSVVPHNAPTEEPVPEQTVEPMPEPTTEPEKTISKTQPTQTSAATKKTTTKQSTQQSTKQSQPQQQPQQSQQKAKCPVCGSTAHTVHPSCPVCGSTAHTVHPQQPAPAPQPVAPPTVQPAPVQPQSPSTPSLPSAGRQTSEDDIYIPPRDDSMPAPDINVNFR